MFKTDVLGTFTKVHEEFGDIASFPWPMNSVIIYSPEFVKKVFIEDGKKYIKGEQIEELRAVVGEGLATNNNYKKWLKSRSIISKEFGPKAVSGFSKAFDRICKEHIAEWKTDVFDICDDMKFLTFKIACQTLLKANLGEKESKAVNEAVHFTSKVTFERIFRFFPIPYFIPTNENRTFNRHYTILNDIVMALIQDEKRGGRKEAPISVLEKLVHAVDDETGTGLSDDELRDEVLTMLLAGHETSAHSLTWTLGLLAKHQDVQANLYDKIKDCEENPEAYLTLIPYMKNVMQESMRLYPAFPILSRKANEDVILGDYKIPKHTNVVIPLYVMQRSAKLWNDPLQFDPTRVEREDLEKSFSYLPFSRGTRKCVAEQFAMTEMSIIIFNVIKNFRLELVGKELSPEIAFMTLKPVGGIIIRALKR